ncbi:nucleoside triphosphate pyrophosphohydrolase [bacterium]|nr:nucleoside triphosphate pyrophosphohydrolase [bacterium]
MKTNEKFQKLVDIMAKLRAPGGCPWDREQSIDDIKAYTLEEVHELFDAIDNRDWDNTKEELGDMLLQIVFYAQFAAEEKKFTIDDAIDSICEKLIRRHPHVFGEVEVKSSKEVLQNWEHIKIKEGKKSLLGGVPKVLPSLLKAYRLGQKSARVGFDWDDTEGILEKLEEEVHELHEAQQKGLPKKEIEHEFGDILFCLANAGRFLDINPEEALRKANNRFVERFHKMEDEIKKRGLDLKKMTVEEMEEVWQFIKTST